MKPRRMRWADYMTRVAEERKVYKALVRKPVGKRPIGKPMRKWEIASELISVRSAGGGGVME
jgi:hypothetical protein